MIHQEMLQIEKLINRRIYLKQLVKPMIYVKL